MSHRTNREDSPADRVILEFLVTKPQPSEQDWLALIADYPELSGEITDAALLFSTSDHLADSDVDAPLNLEVFDAGVSRAISLVHEIPSAILRDAQEKIASIKGPDVRVVANAIGLGSASVLLSGILVGSVEAPRKILDALAKKLESSALVLVECFRRARENAVVPSYKAEATKPGLTTQPKNWGDAVKSLNLSSVETERLLRLQD
jgi:hypothetical protein